MNKKLTAYIVAGLLLVPPISHGYLALETRTAKLYRLQRARASAWLLERLQRPYNLALLVRTEAEAQGINPDLALALVEKESGWNPAAVRPEPALRTASFGLFQLLPETAKSCPGSPSASDLLHPVSNIKCGIFHFSRCLQIGKSYHKALVAYNGGEGCLTHRCPAAESYATSVLSKIL